MLVNASEETLTELANIAYDTVVNGDFSQWETSIRQHMDAGLSESEAKKKVALELGAQVAEAAGSGALMGLGFGAAGSGMQIYNSTQTGKSLIKDGKVAELVEIGKTYSPDSLTYKLAESIGEGASAYEVGNLLRSAGMELSSQNKAEIASALESRGVDPKYAKSIASWLEKGVEGETYNPLQRKAVEYSEDIGGVYGDYVFNQDSAVNQRTQGYNALAQLAYEVATGKTAQENTAPQPSPEETAAKIARFNAENGINLPVSIPKANAETTGKSSEDKSNAGISTELSENQLEVSSEGKNIFDDKELDSLRFVDDNGTIKVKVDDDTVVSHTDVSYANEGLMWVVSSFVDMGIDAASVQGIVDMFEGTTMDEAKVFVSNMKIAYVNGRMHLDKGDLGKLTGKFGITQKQAEDAYRLGEISVQKQTNKAQAEVDKQVAEAEAKAAKGLALII